MKGISSPADHSGKAITINSAGDGFIAVSGGGGGGISSVEPANLDGIDGGAGAADKFIKTDSAGNSFEAVDLGPSEVGITTGSAQAGKIVAMGDAGNQFALLAHLTPNELGLTEGIDEAGKLIAYDTTGQAFTSVAAQSGGADTTLANITGLLNTAKGGTGINASDLNDLRTKLGITASGTGSNTLVRSTNADTQQDRTINQVSSTTASVPTGTGDGIIVRIGNDQWLINFADGKQWKRNLNDSSNGVWSAPANVVLTELTTEADFRTFGEGDRGFTTTAQWLPLYTDGSSPGKVIVGRNGDYLIAIDRENIWWAERPTDDTWTSVPWNWEESNGRIPHGLAYQGGESKETLIPAGEDAVLAGQSGIDGENYIYVLVDHQISGSTSTFTAYFLDDDAAHTTQSATNTRGYTAGTWTRVQTDVDGIDDTIIVKDGVSEEPVFLGITPAFDTIRFNSYIYLLAGEPSLGQVLYTPSTRTLRIKPKTTDSHLNQIFKIGFDLELHKDASNYIRGVINNLTPIANSDEFTATFRSDDLQIAGTIATNDTISIIGRGAVLTNTEIIEPTNLGLPHGSASANQLVAFDSTGQSFVSIDASSISGSSAIEDGAVTTQKLADLAATTAKIANSAIVAGKIGSGAITTPKLSNLAVSHDKIATGAIQPDNMNGLSNDATEAGKAVVFNTAGTGFTTATLSSGGGGASSFDELTGIAATTQGGTGINASDLTDLRAKLGIGTNAGTASDTIPFTSNATHQKNDTLHRVDNTTTDIPTGLDDGLIARTGDDQWAVNLSDGKQWKRSLSDTNDGNWSTPSEATLTELSSASQFVSLAEGGRGFTTTDAWLPEFTDGSKPSKVIVGRHGGYLLALNRYNFWFAPRITDNAATNIAWVWGDGSQPTPAGLAYTGGEADEEYIPAGTDAILDGKAGIDGTNGIDVLVHHELNAAGTTSTYTAFFLNDDQDETIQSSQNTRGYTAGTWTRVRLDLYGISEDIFVPDTDEDGTVRAAFVGVVPEISNLHFGGYTLKASAAGMVAGDVFYSATNRTLYVIHKAADTHLDNLFNIDFEVSIYKDDSNFVRGVFTAVANIPPIGNTPAITGAAFRADDLQSVGTLNAGDIVALRGHKSIITKTDRINPINLGIMHGNAVANQAVLVNSSGTGFTTGNAGVADGAITNTKLAADSITPDKLDGVTTGATESNKVITLDADGTGFTTSTGGSSTPANNSITTAMLQNDVITAAKVEDGAIGSDALASDSVINSKVSDGAIHTDNLADSSVTADKIGSDAIDGTKISDDSIGSEHIIDGAIGTSALAATSVTSAKLGLGSVTSAKLGSSSVTSTKVSAGAIGTTALAADSVTAAKIADGEIGTSAIASGAVTNGKIATGAVSSSSMASNAITPTEMAGITPGASIGGHAIVLTGDGTAFTTSASGGSGGGANDSSGRVYLAEAGGTDTTNAYSSSGTKTETETLYTTPVKMHDRATGGAVFYFTATLQHNSTHSQSWSAKLQARWASSAAAVASATNWTDCDIFNTSDIFLNETITGANRNINHDYSIALPFELADLPTGAVDGQFIQYRVVYSLSANSASGATPVTWIRRARRYYGVGLTGGTGTIADGTITNAMLADDCVGSENLAAGAVNTQSIASDAVGGSKIGNDAVSPWHLNGVSFGADHANKSIVLGSNGGSFAVADLRADGSISTAMLADDAVTSAKIGDRSVVSTSIAYDAIYPDTLAGVATGSSESGKYLILDSNGTSFSTTSSGGGGGGTPADNSITTAMLQNDVITAAKINDGAVGTAALASDSVNGSKIADDAIDASHLSTGSVGSDALAADAVGSSAIGAGAVDTDALAADSVNGSKIADDAIGSEHLIDGSVSTAALASSSVTPAKVGGVSTGASEAGKVLAMNSAGDAFTLVEQSSGGGGGGGDTGGGMPAIYSRQPTHIVSPTAISGSTLTFSAADYALLVNNSGAKVLDFGGYTAFNLQDRLHRVRTRGSNQIRLQSQTSSAWYDRSWSGSGTAANVKILVGGVAIPSFGNWSTDTYTANWETAPWQLADKSTKYLQLQSACSIDNFANSNLEMQFYADLQVGYSTTEDGTYTWVDADKMNIAMVASSSNFNEKHLWARSIPLAGTDAAIGNFENIDQTFIFPLSDLPDAVQDDHYIKFRYEFGETHDVPINNRYLIYNGILNYTILNELGVQTIGGGGSGGGGGGGSTSFIPIIAAQPATRFITPTALTGGVFLTLSAADYASIDTTTPIYVVSTGTYRYSTNQHAGQIMQAIKDGNNRIILKLFGTSSQVRWSGSSGTNPTLAYGGTYVSESNNTDTPIANCETEAWQLADKATKYFKIDTSMMAYLSFSVNWEYGVGLQVGYSTTEDGTYTWVDISDIGAPGTDGAFARGGMRPAGSDSTQPIWYNINADAVFPLSQLPSAVTDDAYIKFRPRIINTSNARIKHIQNAVLQITILDELGTQTIGGGSGGGSSTPADNSITTAMLQDDSITEAKLANDSVRAAAIADNAITNSAVLDHTLELDKIASQYQSTGNYTFQSNVVSGVDDGKFGYTNGSNQTGQIAFNMLATDAGAVSQFLDNRWVVLWKNALNYVVGQQDGAAQTIQGDNTQGEFDLDNVHVVGSFANGDTIKLYYGSANRPHSVAKINHFGDMGVGLVEPDSLGITAGAVNANRIVRVDATGTGFQSTPTTDVGLVTDILMMKQEIPGSGEVSVTSSTRVPLQTQTGTWTVKDKATAFARFNGGGLMYFGNRTAAPILGNAEVWVRWKNGTDPYQSWNLSNSRVSAVNLGSDYLFRIKLYAGGAGQNSHVDCSVGSGNKFVKLSELPSGIVDGSDIQFTLAFQTENAYGNGTGTTFTARRFFLTADILAGAKVHANY